MVGKKSKNYIEALRPKEGYVLQTDIVAKIQRANTANKKEDTLLAFVDIDERMAMDMLSLNFGNRNPTYSDIEKYAKDMFNKKWFFLGNSIKFSVNNHLIDGQKELAAIIHSKTVQRYHIQCALPPAAAFVIDTGRMRSVADALTAAGFKDCNNLAAAIRTVIAMNKYQRTPGTLERNQKIDNQMVVDWTGNKTNISLLQKAVLKGVACRKTGKFFTISTWAGVIYLLNKVNAEDAEYFIEGLATGRDLNTRLIRDNNIYVLREKLNNLNLGVEHTHATTYRDERMRYFMRMWNASRDNEKIHKLSEKTVDFESSTIEKPH